MATFQIEIILRLFCRKSFLDLIEEVFAELLEFFRKISDFCECRLVALLILQNQFALLFRDFVVVDPVAGFIKEVGVAYILGSPQMKRLGRFGVLA